MNFHSKDLAYLKIFFISLLIEICMQQQVAGNGFGLGEVGDFYHICSYEERMFVEPQNCHTKH